MGLAHSVHRFVGIGAGGLVDADDAARKPCVPRSRSQRQNQPSAGERRDGETHEADFARHIHHGGHLCAVLHHDRLRANLFQTPRRPVRIRPSQRLGHSGQHFHGLFADWRRRVRYFHQLIRRLCRQNGPPPLPDFGQLRHFAVRPVHAVVPDARLAFFRVGIPAHRYGTDGHDLRPDGGSAARTVPHRSALFRRIAGV